LREDDQRPSLGQAVLAGVAAALSLLAHGGAFFTLAALALVLCLPRRFPGITQALAAAAAFVLLLLPWWAYQRFDDPPSDRLIKWHLAGVIPIDDRPISRTLIESYAALTPAQLLKNKSDNLRALVGRPFIPPQYLPGKPVDAWRNDAYYNVLKCLGILN